MSKRSTVAQSKEAEREVARILGGRRLHAGEWHGPGDVDVLCDGYIAQVKHRSGVPDYLVEGMEQIGKATLATEELRRLGSSDRPIPMVVLRTKPGRGKGAQTYIVMEVGWFNLMRKRPQ
jgi:hypothetical protein